MTDLGDYGLLFRNCWDLALLLRKLGMTSTIGHFTVVYSVPWPLNGSEAEGDLCYFTNLAFHVQFVLFLCKQGREHHHLHVRDGKFCNKTVNFSLASSRWPRNWAHNCDVAIVSLKPRDKAAILVDKISKKCFAQFEWIRFFIVYRDGHQRRLLVSFVDWRYDGSF